MTDRLGKRDEALLVRLADGALTGAARERVEVRLRAIPDGERRLERQRRVRRALSAGEKLPPLHPAGERPTPRPFPRLVIGGAVAAVVAFLVVLGSHDPRPTAERAAAISQLPATDPAPAASGPVLRAELDGVQFPEWGRRFGWHATGMRRDELGGRQTETVFYEHMGHRLAYTVVSGPPLARPAGARTVERDGLRMSVYRDPAHGGHDVAVFERGGRTCVLAGHVLRVSTLLELAAWKGDGRVRS
jgi:hypothetical protein